MTAINFNNLPEAVGQLQESQSRIEKLLVKMSENLIGNVNKPDRLLSVIEAAALLNLSVPTIYSLVHRRAIPNNKKNKRLYFLQSELESWIKQGHRKSNDEVAVDVEKYLTTKKGPRR
jgi:excisionase family DNA binding protein